MIVVLVLRHFLGGARLSLEGSVKRGEREVKLAVAERRRRGMEVILFFCSLKISPLDFVQFSFPICFPSNFP